MGSSGACAPELDVELRKISPAASFHLGQILEYDDGWKSLMAIIPKENGGGLKYTYEHIKMIETAGQKQKRACAEILFEEWGTSGRKRPRLSTLLDLLVQCQLYRAAEFVAIELLKVPPPQRPATGPAASVAIPDVLNPQDCPNVGKDTIGKPCYNVTPSAPPLPSEPSINSAPTQLCKSEADKGLVYAEKGVTEYTFAALEKGTCSFDNKLKLGSGGFGSVYLCTLQSPCQKVAVKKLKISSDDLPMDPWVEFKNEISSMSSIKHPNILPLLGYSYDGPALCLVYEYMSRGSLENELQNERDVLLWCERLSVAIGTARGLQHLHSMNPKPLVHRDIKSANILLDSQKIPKIGDFGLARLGAAAEHNNTVEMTSNIHGTSAYMAPEAFRGDVSVKMDVFSFGVVLLELVTGLPPFDESREGYDLASHVEEIDDIELLYDKRPTVYRTIIEGLYTVSKQCLLEKKYRLNINQVIEKLTLVI